MLLRQRPACALLPLLALSLSTACLAADRHFVGSGASPWAATPSWSTVQNGAPGASIPGPSDRARFNVGGAGACLILAPVSVGGIWIEAGYAGSVSVATGQSVTVGSQGFTQAAASWTGGNGAMTVTGNFLLSAGTFTSTSGILSLAGTFTQSVGSVFNHGGGTVRPTGSSKTFDVPTTATFFNLDVKMGL